VSDVDDIGALIHSYARLLDEGDIDAVVALFEHSTWRSLPHGSILRGSAGVRPIYEQLIVRQNGRPTKHLITNLSIDVPHADATAAASHCYWTVIQASPGTPVTIDLSGQYTDTFQKVDDRWRFADRLVTVDLSGL
jgi:ketosteroid isomerase-like protein